MRKQPFCFIQISKRKYPKLKEVDDVLGGAAAWENVDSTEGKMLHKKLWVSSHSPNTNTVCAGRHPSEKNTMTFDTIILYIHCCSNVVLMALY